MSDVLSRAAAMNFFILRLLVATVDGYQMPRSIAVSMYEVSQNRRGSVLTICTWTLWVSITVPSGTASISSGNIPPYSLTMISQPSRLNGSPCAFTISSARSISARVIGVIIYCLMNACRPKNTDSVSPPLDSIYELIRTVSFGYCSHWLSL